MSVSSESKKILCRRWVDIQKEEPEDISSNPKYPFTGKKDKKNKRTKKYSICQKSVIRPRFNILTPNKKMDVGYKRNKDSSVTENSSKLRTFQMTGIRQWRQS